MKKRILFLSLLFLSIEAWTAEPTYLRVHHTDGNIVNAQLDTQLVLDFLAENVEYYMALRQNDCAEIQIALVEIQKMTFGEAIEAGIPPETEEPDIPEIGTGEPNTMYIYHKNGTYFSTALDEQVVLRFLEETMQIKLLQQAPTLWMLSDVQKITFSEEEQQPNVSTAVETSFMHISNDVQKVIENGQIIIIRNGVRYNIFGIRL